MKNEILIRKPHDDEVTVLRGIWKLIFGEVGLESFFDFFYDTDLCAVAVFDDKIVSAGYLVHTGELLYDRSSIPCTMIYSIATIPEYRGIGLGTAVVKELIKISRILGCPAVVLCPLEDSLFEFYSKHTGLFDWFYIDEQIYEDIQIKSNIPADGKIPVPEKISAGDYYRMRESLLDGSIHIRQEIRIFEYQVMLCDELGGGLYRIGDSCAVVELQPDGEVWVKELLTAGPDINDLIASIASKFPAYKYIVRSPAKAGKGRRFGMLGLPDEMTVDISKNTTAPWFGMAFD